MELFLVYLLLIIYFIIYYRYLPNVTYYCNRKHKYFKCNIYIDDVHADTDSNDLLWPSQKYDSPLASTSKGQIPNVCDDNNIDSQITTQSSSTKKSLFFTEDANISDNNLTLATGKLRHNYI